MSGFLSHGFIATRLPAGHYIEAGFPVVTAEPTPIVDTDSGPGSQTDCSRP